MTINASAPAPATPQLGDGGMVGPGYRGYALIVLFIIYTLNFLDRQVVSILAEPIKNDLKLADWQLGLMTGFAFAFLYTILGLPIARISERANRPLLIGCAVAIWSGFTALCGLAQNFWQLVLARVGVGVGEAGCSPPAMSLIADYAPKEQRASALAVYLMGAPVGGLLGMAMGGVVADHWGWRAAFLVAGAPGLVVALLAGLTLVEPRKRLTQEQRVSVQEQAPPLKEALKEFARSRTYWFVVSAVTMKAFISYGTTAFIGSFFFRNHADELASLSASVGLQSAGFLGLALGLVTGLVGAFGTWGGGHLADRLGKNDLRGYMVLPAVGAIVAIPFSLTALSVDSLPLALAIFVIPSLLNAVWQGPAYATIQGLVQPRTRATATAVLLFVANLVGLGLGPLIVGIMSDVISNALGGDPAASVRWSLIVVALFGLPCGLLFWGARKHIRAETVS